MHRSKILSISYRLCFQIQRIFFSMSNPSSFVLHLFDQTCVHDVKPTVHNKLSWSGTRSGQEVSGIES